MSAWFKAEDDEIDIDTVNNEVDIYACSDNQGRVYITISFDQIKEIASKIERLGSNK
mgnify:CR=1 FL=1